MPASNEEFIKRAFESGLTEEQVRAALKERNAQPQPEKPGFNPLEVMLGNTMRVTQDVTSGLAQRQTGAAESQQGALDSVGQLQQRAQTATPEQKMRLLNLAQQISGNVSGGAQQQAGEFSQDVQQNPLWRGLKSGTELATTYEGASRLASAAPGAIGKTKDVIAGGAENTISLAKKLANPKKLLSEARQAAAQQYPNFDVSTARQAVSDAVNEYNLVDPDSTKYVESVVKSINNANDLPALLDRTSIWNKAYTAAGQVGKSSKAGTYDVATRALKEVIKTQAPEVAKYTDYLRLAYQLPKTIKRGLFYGGIGAGGIAGAKSLLSE